MKTITIKYLGATNHKPSRIKASDEDGHSVIRTYDDEYSSKGNAAVVAQALKEKMNWSGDMLCGSTKDGYIFVFDNEEDKLRTILKNL